MSLAAANAAGASQRSAGTPIQLAVLVRADAVLVLQPRRRLGGLPGLLPGQRRAGVRELQGELEDGELGPVGRPTLLPHLHQQVPRQGRGVGEAVGRLGHRAASLLEHMFERKTFAG